MGEWSGEWCQVLNSELTFVSIFCIALSLDNLDFIIAT